MIQVFNYDDKPIQFEVIGGQVMANATLMFKANGSRLDKWRESNPTKRYIQAVTLKWGIDDNQLVVTKKGGNDQGTWIHEKLILNAARYISVDFELWCDEKIAELLKTGTVSAKPKTAAEQLLESAMALVEHEQRLNSLESKIDYLVENRSRAEKQIKSLPLSTTTIPEQSERTKILRLVNGYCRMTGISSHDTWSKLYSDLYYLYNISVRAYKKRPNERTYLDVIERLGHLDKLHALISAMIYDLDQMAS